VSPIEYHPLPAHVDREVGSVTSCWKLKPAELAEIQRTGVLWISQLNFGEPLQPILPMVFNPFEVQP
jgi:hypothetical protein